MFSREYEAEWCTLEAVRERRQSTACDVSSRRPSLSGIAMLRYCASGGLLWILSSGLLEAWNVQAVPHLLRP